MVERAYLQDVFDAGPLGSGIEATALLGTIDAARLPNIPADKLPATRLTPDPTSLGPGDEGDLVVWNDTAGEWQTAAFDDGTQTTAVYTAGSWRINWQQSKKGKEVEDAFEGGGWTNSLTAQVSSTIKVGSVPHTAGEITGLTYVTFRTQPSPNSAPGYIAVRILLQDKAKVALGQIRTTEGERANPLPYDPNILLTDAMHVTDSGDYAYYSVLDADGFVSDDATWVQDIEPFHLDDRYVEISANDVFDAQAWAASTGNLLGATTSSTAYTQHNNNIRTVTLWGNSHAVTATTGDGFYIPVRIPIADRGALAHYRLTSTRDSSVHAITASDYVVDSTDGTYALYNVHFPAGAATTIALEEREEHLFDPRKGTINFVQLGDTPAAYGTAGHVVQINAAANGLEFGAADTDLSGVRAGAGLARTPATGESATGTVTLSLGTQDGTGTTALGAAVVTITNQNFNNRNSVVAGTWNIPEAGEFSVKVEIGGVDYTGQFFAEDLRGVNSSTVGTTTTDTGTNYLPVRVRDETGGGSLWLRLLRTAGNEAHYATNINIQGVNITIRPVIVQGLIEDNAWPSPEYHRLAADVNLPVGASNDAPGAWTEIWRYTNSGGTEWNGLIGWSINPTASWTATSGAQRGGADFRVRQMNSSDTQVRVLISEAAAYVRNGNTGYANLSRHGDFSDVWSVELPVGDYVIIEGRGYSQVRSAGQTIDILATETDFFTQETIAGSGAAAAQQVASSSAPRYLRVWRRAAANVTPTLPAEFSGVAWTNISGWNFFPVTGTTPAGQALWYGEVEAVHTPGATMDWQTTATVKPANDVRFSTVQNPRTDAAISATPPASGGYWQFYDAATGWGTRWFPLETEPDWSFLDQVDWRPNAVGSTANIDFPNLDTAQYSGLAFLVFIYNSGGHDVSEIINFQLEPLPPISAVAPGTVTIRDTDGGNMTWERRVSPAGIEWGDFNLPGGANQANYGKFGCNFQLQHRSATGTSRIDRVAFSSPAVYRTTADIRWRIELWARRA